MSFKILISFLLFAIAASAQSGRLRTEIELLKKDRDLRHASWSVCVMNADKDTVTMEYNSALSLIPASTLKIVTTAAALSFLGKDFTFKTLLQYDGILDTITGTLKGNLYIMGGGDPTLDSENFRDKKDSLSTAEKWARIIRQKGIKRIQGDIIADESIFEDNLVPGQWIWSDIGNYFGAGACGLSYHDNKYTAYFNSGKTGELTTIARTDPVIPQLKLYNHVTAGGNADNAFIYGAPYSGYRMASGTIPAGRRNYEVEGSIPDPALFCAQALHAALVSLKVEGIRGTFTVRQMKEAEIYTPAKRTTLHTHVSPPLEKIVYWTNLKSINLYAEHLLKYIAYKKTGFGTTNAGTEIITEYWKSKGVDVEGFFMNDGSGLARANVITTRTQTQILAIMSKDKNFTPFFNSLPVAGRPGSLGGLCIGTFAENNLRAKSGYISRARGYCGYVKNRKGELLCFSMIANNFSCSPSEMKKKLEKVLVGVAECE